MNYPRVSVLIPTYTRTRILVEALQSALFQDYAGDIEIMILNDQHRQVLAFEGAPRSNIVVRAVNCWDLFPSLGAKRNAMLKQATGDWVTFLDDDDLWMPWHLRQVMAHAREGVTAVFPQHQYKHWLGQWSWEDVPGGINIAVNTTLARRIGFDEKLNVGEDNAFRNGVLERVGTIPRPGGPGHVYRPTAPVMHISRALRGCEVDRSIFLDHAEKELDDGREPEGRVVLKPAWAEDYVSTIYQRFPDTVPKQYVKKVAT